MIYDIEVKKSIIKLYHSLKKNNIIGKQRPQLIHILFIKCGINMRTRF